MPTGRKGVFIGYNKYTIFHYKLYTSDIYIIIISNNIKFFKDILNSSINNYQLWIKLSNRSFKQLEGIYNKLLIQNKRDCSTRLYQEPIINLI